MNVVKEIQRLNAREASLSTSHSQTGSWHEQYKDSAHIFAGGLPYNLTEGDVICVFSQFGEIAGINLVRDKDTGKSKGFAFIKYVDQRSTILAIGGRTIRVDHVQNYKVPKVFDADGNEIEPDEEMVNNAVPKPIQEDSGEDSSSDSEVDDTGIDLDDPMREYLLKKRKKEARKAKRKAEKEANHGGRSESKAERKARKEQKKAAKKDKEAKKDKKDKENKNKLIKVEDAQGKGSRKEEQHDKKNEDEDKSKDQDSGDKKSEDNHSNKDIEASTVNKTTTTLTAHTTSNASPGAASGDEPAMTMTTKDDGTTAGMAGVRIGTATGLVVEIDPDTLLPRGDGVHHLTRVVEDMTAEHRGTLEVVVAVRAGAGALEDAELARIAAAAVGAEVLVDREAL
ncbi:hypothetical protein BGZ75_004136 [Mortierella antarctica]|nr:hypothetical protein BGZ75_004136 [Mortierella antarctica]